MQTDFFNIALLLHSYHKFNKFGYHEEIDFINFARVTDLYHEFTFPLEEYNNLFHNINAGIHAKFDPLSVKYLSKIDNELLQKVQSLPKTHHQFEYLKSDKGIILPLVCNKNIYIEFISSDITINQFLNQFFFTMVLESMDYKVYYIFTDDLKNPEILDLLFNL